MSATDFRQLIDIHKQGAITLEVSDGKHLILGIMNNDGTTATVTINYFDAGFLSDALSGAMGHML